MRSRQRPQAVRLRDLDHYRPRLLPAPPPEPLHFEEVETLTVREWLGLVLTTVVIALALWIGATCLFASGGFHP